MVTVDDLLDIGDALNSDALNNPSLSVADQLARAVEQVRVAKAARVLQNVRAKYHNFDICGPAVRAKILFDASAEQIDHILIAQALIERAKEGNLQAIEQFHNRTLGRAADSLTNERLEALEMQSQEQLIYDNPDQLQPQQQVFIASETSTA